MRENRDMDRWLLERDTRECAPPRVAFLDNQHRDSDALVGRLEAAVVCAVALAAAAAVACVLLRRH